MCDVYAQYMCNICVQGGEDIYVQYIYMPIEYTYAIYMCSICATQYIYTRCICAIHVQHMRTEWRRCAGCLKVQVSFRKRATDYRALWRKVTYQNKGGEDAQDALSLFSFSATENYNEWLCCGKRPTT